MSEFHDPGSASGASLDRRVAALEQIAADTRDALRRLDNRLDGLEGRLDRRFDAIDLRFDRLRDELSRTLRWLLGLWFASLGAVLAVMAHGFRWL
jgi:hypothetical protein